MKSIKRLKIKKSAIDFNNHVNYSIYLKLYSKGQNEFWKKHDLSFKKIVENYSTSPFIRYMEVEYMGQLFEGDIITIHTEVVNVGTTSITYFQTIRRKRKVINRAKMIAVFTKKGKAVSIPKTVRKKLETG